MSARELTRVEVLARVKAGALSVKSAAVLLHVSSREAKRLVRRYRAEGAKGLTHRSAGRPSTHARPTAERERALAFVREKYSGPVDERFGPTLAAEQLASEDGITVHHDTLRRWMLTAGLWSRARQRSPHRARRARKGDDASRSVVPITAEDITPIRVLESADDKLYWRTDNARQIGEGLRELRFSGRIERTDRDTPAWRTELRQYLLRLEKWRPEGDGDGLDYFHEKAGIMETLIAITPDSDERIKILSDFVMFLNDWDLGRGGRAEWFSEGQKLLDPQFRASAHDANGVIQGLLRSNPVFSLYLDLEAITGPRDPKAFHAIQ